MTLVPPTEPPASDGSAPEDEARRLQVLFDGLPALVGYWDTELRNVIANEAYAEWFGITPEQMKGRHISEIIGQDVFARNGPFMRKALGGDEQVFERTLVDTHGRTRHTEGSYVPYWVDGEVVGIFTLVTDVTQHVETQRQLDEAQELAGVGSWTLIPSTRQISWSRQMYRIMGRDPETFTPTADSVLPHVHPADRDQVVDSVRQAVKSGRNYEMSYRIVRPDGDVRDVFTRVRAERSGEAGVTRVTGVLQDVTSSHALNREMARVNERLSKVNQLNADVLGVVGHDVRTPLALVLGHLEELSATWEEETEETKQMRVDKAFGAARRLSALIDDILAMANFDSGSIATRPVRADLREVITEALAGLHGAAKVEMQIEGSPVSYIDPFHLRQMVANLVSNALRYGELPVLVTVLEEDDGVSLEVTDAGEGVPEDFVPHLFDRFTRASTGTAAQQSGSGFGLYIVNRLADANGCRLTYSPGVPSGSRFRLELPCDSSPG
jgi:PAS domain S-box-containing protein